MKTTPKIEEIKLHWVEDTIGGMFDGLVLDTQESWDLVFNLIRRTGLSPGMSYRKGKATLEWDSGLVEDVTLTFNHGRDNPFAGEFVPTKRYKIVRMFKDGHPAKVIKTGLLIGEARRHCSDPETSSQTCEGAKAKRLTRLRGEWFDGFVLEGT